MRVKNTRKIEVKRLCRSFLDLNAFDLGESLQNLLRELARLWSPKLSCKDAVEIPLSYITGTLDITSFPRPLLYYLTPRYNNIICIHICLLYKGTRRTMNIIISELQEVRAQGAYNKAPMANQSANKTLYVTCIQLPQHPPSSMPTSGTEKAYSI